MTILVTGSTGKIGSRVLHHLAGQSVTVKALVRDGGKDLPEYVQKVEGNLADPDSMRAALDGVDTLFLLNAVSPDELTQALITLDIAAELGIERIVYFSVFNGPLFTDVPHFTAKHTVEQVIDARALPATILRPAYFFQNDAMFGQAIQQGMYPMPIGSVGVAMVDADDIAAVAASELVRRDRSPVPLPRTTIEIVGPETLTGPQVAAIWSEVTGRDVRYGGDDLAANEKMTRQFAPAWQARDMRMMLRAFHQYGMTPSPTARSILYGVLGREPKSYSDFAREVAAGWEQKA